jgi:hypothetical protein
MENLFAVEIVRYVYRFKLEEAVEYARTYRERGYGTRVLTMNEANAKMAENQQDLFVVSKAFKGK